MWPLSVRLIHWALAAVIILDMFWLEDELHNYAGYFGVTLIFLRLIIGIRGKGLERLSSLPLKFSDFEFYLRHHFSGKAHYEGHNPAAWMVYFLMWLVVISLGVTGWMMGLDAYWGDEGLHNIHVYLSNALLFLIALHFIGMALDAIIYKRKTWMAMISGRK